MKNTILTLLTAATLSLGACQQEVVGNIVPALPKCDLVEKVQDSNGKVTKTILDHDQDCKPEWVITKDYDVNGNLQHSEVEGYTNGVHNLTFSTDFVNCGCVENENLDDYKFKQKFGEK